MQSVKHHLATLSLSWSLSLTTLSLAVFFSLTFPSSASEPETKSVYEAEAQKGIVDLHNEKRNQVQPGPATSMPMVNS